MNIHLDEAYDLAAQIEAIAVGQQGQVPFLLVEPKGFFIESQFP